MLKSVIGALLLGALTAAGFAGVAQAGTWDCPLPTTRGGCSMVPQPQLGPHYRIHKAHPQG
jgi:hypothetical protein